MTGSRGSPGLQETKRSNSNEKRKPEKPLWLVSTRQKPNQAVVNYKTEDGLFMSKLSAGDTMRLEIKDVDQTPLISPSLRQRDPSPGDRHGFVIHNGIFEVTSKLPTTFREIQNRRKQRIGADNGISFQNLASPLEQIGVVSPGYSNIMPSALIVFDQKEHTAPLGAKEHGRKVQIVDQSGRQPQQVGSATKGDRTVLSTEEVIGEVSLNPLDNQIIAKSYETTQFGHNNPVVINTIGKLGSPHHDNDASKARHQPSTFKINQLQARDTTQDGDDMGSILLQPYSNPESRSKSFAGIQREFLKLENNINSSVQAFGVQTGVRVSDQANPTSKTSVIMLQAFKADQNNQGVVIVDSEILSQCEKTPVSSGVRSYAAEQQLKVAEQESAQSRESKSQYKIVYQKNKGSVGQAKEQIQELDIQQDIETQYQNSPGTLKNTQALIKIKQLTANEFVFKLKETTQISEELTGKAKPTLYDMAFSEVENEYSQKNKNKQINTLKFPSEVSSQPVFNEDLGPNKNELFQEMVHLNGSFAIQAFGQSRAEIVQTPPHTITRKTQSQMRPWTQATGSYNDKIGIILTDGTNLSQQKNKEKEKKLGHQRDEIGGFKVNLSGQATSEKNGKNQAQYEHQSLSLDPTLHVPLVREGRQSETNPIIDVVSDYLAHEVDLRQESLVILQPLGQQSTGKNSIIEQKILTPNQSILMDKQNHQNIPKDSKMIEDIIRRPIHHKPPAYLAKEDFGQAFKFRSTEPSGKPISRNAEHHDCAKTSEMSKYPLNIRNLCSQSRQRQKSRGEGHLLPTSVSKKQNDSKIQSLKVGLKPNQLKEIKCTKARKLVNKQIEPNFLITSGTVPSREIKETRTTAMCPATSMADISIIAITSNQTPLAPTYRKIEEKAQKDPFAGQNYVQEGPIQKISKQGNGNFDAQMNINMMTFDTRGELPNPHPRVSGVSRTGSYESHLSQPHHSMSNRPKNLGSDEGLEKRSTVIQNKERHQSGLGLNRDQQLELLGQYVSKIGSDKTTGPKNSARGTNHMVEQTNQSPSRQGDFKKGVQRGFIALTGPRASPGYNSALDNHVRKRFKKIKSRTLIQQLADARLARTQNHTQQEVSESGSPASRSVIVVLGNSRPGSVGYQPFPHFPFDPFNPLLLVHEPCVPRKSKNSLSRFDDETVNRSQRNRLSIKRSALSSREEPEFDGKITIDSLGVQQLYLVANQQDEPEKVQGSTLRPNRKAKISPVNVYPSASTVNQPRYGERQLFPLPTSVVEDLFKEQAEFAKEKQRPFGIKGTQTLLRPLKSHQQKTRPALQNWFEAKEKRRFESYHTDEDNSVTRTPDKDRKPQQLITTESEFPAGKINITQEPSLPVGQQVVLSYKMSTIDENGVASHDSNKDENRGQLFPTLGDNKLDLKNEPLIGSEQIKRSFAPQKFIHGPILQQKK